MSGKRRFCSFLVLPVLAACATQTPTAVEQNPSRIEYSYVSPDADFSKYRGLLFVPLEILNPDRTPMRTSDDLELLRAEFRHAFIKAMDGEYMLLTRPANDVMRIKAQLIDAEFAPTTLSSGPGLSFDELAAGGELEFFMQMEDSYSGTLLARASDRSVLGAARTDQERLERIRDAAKYWAGLFKVFLDANLQNARTR